MANSPCGGCPPHCKVCVFAAEASTHVLSGSITVVVPAKQYGCVKGYGDVAVQAGQLGQVRDDGFHPVTEAGAMHLRTSGNALAAHL